jgi:hypothetical protein
VAITANNLVVQHRKNLHPSIQATNVVVESEIKEKFQYAQAPDVIPEKDRSREKRVSHFIDHMTTFEKE